MQKDDNEERKDWDILILLVGFHWSCYFEILQICIVAFMYQKPLKMDWLS